MAGSKGSLLPNYLPESLHQLASHKRSGVERDCILAPPQLWISCGTCICKLPRQTAPTPSGPHHCDYSSNSFRVYLLSGIMADSLGTLGTFWITTIMKSKCYWPKFIDEETEARGLGGPAPNPDGSFQKPDKAIVRKPSLSG